MIKWYQALTKRLRQWAVIKIFRKHFGRLVYSFESADDKIEKLTETQKTMYYEAVTNWVESEAYALEDKGKVEDCYAFLATTAPNEDIMTAYRVALLILKNQDVRLRSKVQKYREIQATKQAFSNINKN